MQSFRKEKEKIDARSAFVQFFFFEEKKGEKKWEDFSKCILLLRTQKVQIFSTKVGTEILWQENQ